MSDYMEIKDARGGVKKLLAYVDGSSIWMLYRRVFIRNSADDADIDPVAETSFTSRVGEVQATPTANTVLGRLKDISEGISGSSPIQEDTYTGSVGEVQPSPTNYTILARLKELLTGIVLAKGSNVIGKVELNATYSGGCSRYRNIDLDENGVCVAPVQSQLYGWNFINAAVAARYVKIYNKATAPSVGTDTPFITIMIPASSERSFNLNVGVEFGLGVGLGATTGVADADTGAPSANDVMVHLFYKPYQPVVSTYSAISVVDTPHAAISPTRKSVSDTVSVTENVTVVKV